MQTVSKPPSAIQILLAEDSSTDADLTIRALRKGRFENAVHHVKDGVEALAFLHREGEYRDAPTPDLVLLDLNMPRMDGRELLREIRGDASLNTIAVVVLTTSDSELDVLASYGLCADACIVKPVDLKKLLNAIGDIDRFWLRVVKRPFNAATTASPQ
jgi:two-component system, chemotaxis family, response regulator Rcp1